MKRGNLLRVVLMVAAVMCMGARGGGRGRQDQTPPASQPAAPSQLAQDRATEAQAQTAYGAAKKTVDDLTAKLLADFQQGKDWLAAQATVTQAQANLNTVLAGNSEYHDALVAKQKAVDALNAAKAEDESATDTIAPLAMASEEATVKLAQLQKQIAEEDPQVQSAQGEVAAAQKNLDSVKEQFLQSLPSNADYAAAKTALDTAAQAVSDAHAKVVADGG